MKTVFLHCCRLIGLFRLARFLTRDRLRILCYHGIALQDEHLFSPGTFMRAETFRRRLSVLKQRNYPVCSLEEGLRRLKEGTLEKGSVAITIDDGWFGTHAHMAPILKEFGYPAMLYVATYYITRDVPVFNMAAAYLLWKTRTKQVRLSGLGPEIDGRWNLANAKERNRLAVALFDLGEKTDGVSVRQDLLRKLCSQCGQEYEEMFGGRIFEFMDRHELSDLPAMGVELQLHTHRHRLSFDNPNEVTREINDNRDALKDAARSPLEHFCYPSGRYALQHAGMLEAVGVKSATTCEIGLNSNSESPYFLKRILDSEVLGDIELEAELSGFMEFKRRLWH